MVKCSRYYRIREVGTHGRMVISSLGIFRACNEKSAIRKANKYKIDKSAPIEVSHIKKKNINRYSDIVR